MAFCIDTNIFVQAHRSTYPIDMMPGFWEGLLNAAEKKLIFSIELVYEELTASTDELSEWAIDHHDVLFRKNDDAATQQALREVGEFLETRSPAYRDEAKELFLDGADPWVIAFAKAHGHTVVTEEVEAPTSKRSVKIPDVCAALEVSVVNTIQMLRALGVKW